MCKIFFFFVNQHRFDIIIVIIIPCPSILWCFFFNKNFVFIASQVFTLYMCMFKMTDGAERSTAKIWTTYIIITSRRTRAVSKEILQRLEESHTNAHTENAPNYQKSINYLLVSCNVISLYFFHGVALAATFLFLVSFKWRALGRVRYDKTKDKRVRYICIIRLKPRAADEMVLFEQISETTK